MRIVLAIVLALHGIAHIVGFLGAWHPERLEGFTYRTTLFGGFFNVGDAGIRILGLLWLAIAVAFVLVGGVALAHRPGWIALSLGATAVSFVLCIAGWPDAKIGVAVNAVLALALVIGQRAGWIS